jgi:hypothetical protein
MKAQVSEGGAPHPAHLLEWRRPQPMKTALPRLFEEHSHVR